MYFLVREHIEGINLFELRQQFQFKKKYLLLYIYKVSVKILKASAKHCFRKPPNRYSRAELENLLLSGQESRYQTTEEFKNEIENLFTLVSKK